VGTTVKVARFFEYIPVRKQTATKDSAKCLAKIRRLVQAYALARPAIRIRLHVLKARNNKVDFIYAPKASSNIEDAVFRVIGKDCALQCDWTAVESDGFEIQAFLPKSTTNGSKIANQGAFVSVDSRPVSSSRGTIKQIVVAFKERLRKSNSALANVKDPFFSMSISCPPDSYDPNIEPAKDDVLFDDSDVVLGAVDKLLRSYYPEAVIEEESDPPTSAQRSYESRDNEMNTAAQFSSSEWVEFHRAIDEEPTSEQRSDLPQWRASMYGIDEEDLGCLQNNLPPIIEEEELGRRAVEVSNPWTIARMNATIKPNKTAFNGQLLSPAKSHDEGRILQSSSAPQTTPRKVSQINPLTPQTSSSANVSTSSLDREIEQNRYHIPQPSMEYQYSGLSRDSPQDTVYDRPPASLPLYEAETSGLTPIDEQRPTQTRDFHDIVSASPAPRRKSRKQNTHSNGSFADTQQGPDDTWFGQPMRGSQNVQSTRRPKRRTDRSTPLFASDAVSRTILTAADQLNENRLLPGRNTDIRKFLTQNGGGRVERRSEVADVPSFPSINSSSQFNSGPRDMTDESRAGSERCRSSSQPSFSRAMPFELLPRTQDNRNALQRRDRNNTSKQPRKCAEQFEVYKDSFNHSPRPRPSSAGSEQRLSLMPTTPNKSMILPASYGTNKPSQNSYDMATYFKEYQDRDETSADILSNPTRRPKAHIAASHEVTNTPYSQRRLTTDVAHRITSSKLPLERVPHGYHTQDTILNLHLSIASMIQTSRKMDMCRNSLEWGYPTAEDAYDAFVEPIAERGVEKWVVTLVALLHKRYEQVSAADFRCILQEAIQRGLSVRKYDEAIEIGEMPAAVTDEDVSTAGRDSPKGPQHGEHASYIEVEDHMSEFDMSQFVDFEIKTTEDKDRAPAQATEESGKKAEEELGDDIDDDMLLDM
jgi:DNA mismatch repair ATPase MutL